MANRKFWFGKHKGKDIISICIYEPSYVEWCLSNVKNFKLNEEEQKYLQTAHKTYRCSYDDNEGSVWDEFDREMTYDMMHNLD